VVRGVGELRAAGSMALAAPVRQKGMIRPFRSVGPRYIKLMKHAVAVTPAGGHAFALSLYGPPDVLSEIIF